MSLNRFHKPVFEHKVGDTVKRRDILLGSAVASGLAATGHGQEIPTRVRFSATDPRAAANLQAFGAAVKHMQAITDPSNSDSWMYWANVHGTTVPVPVSLRGIWATCDHGAYFLAWHRLYLLSFEAVVSRLSGKADFAMPYWNWYASADVPAPFEDGGSNNPLWRAARGYARKYPVTAGVLDYTEYGPFNANAFGDPHSPIHVNFTGDMARPGTAARDPIFWPHHVAMDRLWDIWLHMPERRNPDKSTAWAAKEFRFLVSDSSGKTVRSVLDSSELGYRYDTLIVGQNESVAASSVPARPPRILKGTANVGPILEGAAGPRSISERVGTRLHGSSVTIQLPLPLVQPMLESVGAPGPTRSSATLRLNGVTLTREGARTGVLYDVYVNLPRHVLNTGMVIPMTRHRIGQINSFLLGDHGEHDPGHSQHTSNFEFKLDQLIPRLKSEGAWDPNAFEINLVEPSERASKLPLITINRIQLLVERVQ